MDPPTSLGRVLPECIISREPRSGDREIPRMLLVTDQLWHKRDSRFCRISDNEAKRLRDFSPLPGVRNDIEE